MTAKSKKSKITDDAIIEMYMNYVLEHEAEPKSVFIFCNAHKIEEVDFYQFFGSVETLQKAVWVKFYEHTIALMQKNKAYASFSNKDKMLTFFYSFFELLTMNRSYVLFTLKNNKSILEGLSQLKGLRTHVKAFATELIEDRNETKTLKITKHNPKIFSEGAWVQFMFILKFWMDDTSPGFEKTDVAIEKSIHTAFDVFEHTPLENIIDFGKFLYKERMT